MPSNACLESRVFSKKRKVTCQPVVLSVNHSGPHDLLTNDGFVTGLSQLSLYVSGGNVPYRDDPGGIGCGQTEGIRPNLREEMDELTVRSQYCGRLEPTRLNSTHSVMVV